ncbi:MAG: hypothetical protein HQL56_11515 [Magnetococcales bacterium]|nr:hypothetical protein [Magnetococcales bacterium]
MTQATPFLQPRLVGKRFAAHTIPLEMLKDLAVLGEMLLEVAKWHYLQDNPHRKRVPQGFTDGHALCLSGLEPGSATATITLSSPTKGLYAPEEIPSEGYRCFLEARYRFLSALHAVNTSQSLTTHLNDPLLSLFDRFGRSLREDESIHFALENGETVFLDRPTRRKLLFASPKMEEIAEEVCLRGRVPVVDQDRMTFTLQRMDGTRLPVSRLPRHHERLMQAFNGYAKGVRVQVRGIGRYNRSNRLQGIDNVEELTLLDPLDVSARLDDFRLLADGWLDGEGRAFLKENLDWFDDRFERLFPGDLPLPHLYPTAEGGLQAEWTLEGHEITLDVDLVNRKGQWTARQPGAGKVQTRELDLGRDEAWGWLVRQMRDRVPKEAGRAKVRTRRTG